MNKKEKYADVFRMIQSVVEGESDMVANMANTAALLHEEFGFWWTGFYRVEQESKQLVASRISVGTKSTVRRRSS